MSLGLIVHLTDIGTGEGGVGRITNTRNEGDNTPAVSTRPPLRPNIGPEQNNCNSIVRHDFCFLYNNIDCGGKK